MKNTIEEYYLKFTEKLTFLELKKENPFISSRIKIKDGMPLPLLTDKMVHEIREGNYENEIKLKDFVEGMLFMVGCDENFVHVPKYFEILQRLSETSKAIAFYRGLEEFDADRHDDAAIFYRAACKLSPESANLRFNLAICYEKTGMALAEKDLVLRDLFFEQALREFETILESDPEFELAYYKLGYFYRYYRQFIKARHHWQKYLELASDDIRKQEVRDGMEAVENEATLEEAEILAGRGDMQHALDLLLPLSQKWKNRADLYYLMGTAYKYLTKTEEALEAFHHALEFDPKNPDLYIEIANLEYERGRFEAAEKMFSLGVENCEMDFRLYFNRSLALIHLRRYDEAMKDLKTADRLNPDNEMVIRQTNALKAHLKKL